MPATTWWLVLLLAASHSDGARMSDVTVSSKNHRARDTINVATWNILDVPGTFNEMWGCPMEIELANRYGQKRVIKDRQQRILKQLSSWIAEFNLDVIALQEVDKSWQDEFVARLSAVGFVTVCRRGEALLFLREEVFDLSNMSVLDYNFTHEKYGEGACAAVVTVGDRRVIFSSIHVATSMRKKANKKMWATQLREAILNHRPNLTDLDPMVVLADFNADLTSKSLSDSFRLAGWSVGTVTEPPFTTEHQTGVEGAFDGFLTRHIEWQTLPVSEFTGFMPKAVNRNGVPSKYAYVNVSEPSPRRELMRDGKLLPGNSNVESLSDHLLVHGTVSLAGSVEVRSSGFSYRCGTLLAALLCTGLLTAGML